MTICCKCKLELPPSDFAKDSSRRTGLQSSCKRCASEMKRQWFQKNQSAVAARIREYRQNNRDVIAAHKAVEAALKIGAIRKAKHCQDCKKRSKLEGHHWDYSRPLDVVWLCRSCHIARHKNLGIAG